MKPIYAARVTIEAETPLKVGGSAIDFFQDRPVQRDWNGLPMILGTSIAGVLRRAFDDEEQKAFGYLEMHTNDGEGSKVIVSNALLVDEHDRVTEGLLERKSAFLSHFEALPVREHVAIDDKGCAVEHAKFDEEVVYKGTRFRFAIEVIEDETFFEALLDKLSDPVFRLGGGTTKGFGRLKITEVRTKTIDTPQKLAEYTSSLNGFGGTPKTLRATPSAGYTRYVLDVTPDDFFMFGSGFGDEDADMTPVYEKVVDYEKKQLSKRQILIPASSVKGALSHRTAFHYNRIKGAFIGSGQEKTREENAAVKAIFGHKKERGADKTELGQKGKLLISDCFQAPEGAATKTFDHVSIDRFTGGAIEGALFQEKTVADTRAYTLEIWLEVGIENAEAVEAFECALKDIAAGRLPLGGATTKGHGFFHGTLTKNGEVL